MKICLGFIPKDEPWGGGNQFAQSFVRYFRGRGYQVVHSLDPDTDIAVMLDPRPGDGRPFSHVELAIAKKRSNGRLRVIHRVNVTDTHKRKTSLEDVLFKGNQCADHTVFISEWLRNYFLAKWTHYQIPNSVIRNGADENVFNSTGQIPWDGIEPLKIVTHHWSDNRLKGADIYDMFDQYLSDPLFREQVQFSYIGRPPVDSYWSNISVQQPMYGEQLASAIRQHHVYLTASRLEACGMHHIEGALCGLPLLYHAEGGGIVECCRDFGIMFKNDSLLLAITKMKEQYSVLKSKLKDYPLDSTRMLQKWESLIQQVARGDNFSICISDSQNNNKCNRSINSKALHIAIPLHGKMSTRTFHTTNVQDTFTSRNIGIRYLLSPRYYSSLPPDKQSGYGQLLSDRIDAFIEEHPMLTRFMLFRYFCTRTESVDLRLREHLENVLYEGHSVGSVWRYAAFHDLVRRIPKVGLVLSALESSIYKTMEHTSVLTDVDCVLVPGLGNWSFFNECMVARESLAMGKPAFSVITNYDNIVNRGYRGYMPTAVAVWSCLMADEAMRIQGIPAKRIEITGPVQYDTFSQPVRKTRQDFLLEKGLDPAKKTIFFASGVNPTRIFEFCNLFFNSTYSSLFEQCNLVIRLYPDPRVLKAPEWTLLKKEMSNRNGVYVSDPLPYEFDSLHTGVGALDLWGDEDISELHNLLAHSDVMINFFSTISLEAAICNTPTIHIGYDEYVYGRQFKQRVSFLQAMTHNKRTARIEASRVVMSAKQLINEIELYLSDRNRDSEARKRYAKIECGELDGRAAERLADMIRSRISN
jgi:CDP-glycerol glycerophosphotransferase (TagB/SpsB family)